MMFNAIYPLRGTFSTEDLNWEIQRLFSGDPRNFSLEEDSEGLIWNKNRVNPKIIHLYFPDPPEPVPDTASEAEEDGIFQFPREKRKEVWVPEPLFYRTEAINGRWVAAPNHGCYVTPGGLNGDIETLFLQETYAILERYIVTENPKAEDTPMEFDHYETPDGKIIITDLRRYTERLRIPSEIDHKPVAFANIPYSRKVRHLRELIVEEGVQRIEFCWTIPELDEIELPSSTMLVQPPDYLYLTHWYQKQPEGEIYFANWYISHKGPILEDRTLRIQEGTLGVISNADRDIEWRKIVLPPSVTYLGSGAFSLSRETAQVSSSKALAAAFNPFLYEPDDIADDDTTTPFRCESGKVLYDLCSKCGQLRPYLRAGYYPLPPKLFYRDHHWFAEFRLTREDHARRPYRAIFSLVDGKLHNPPTKVNHLGLSSDCLTEEYKFPAYLRSIEYLDYGAHLVMVNSEADPEEQELELLDTWWRILVPEWRYVYELD